MKPLEGMEVDLDRLRTDLSRLTAAPRPAESAELESARQYVERALAAAGWVTRRHAFTASTTNGTSLTGINLVASRPPNESGSSDRDRARFCLGAHLDSLPDTVGADDNASGVAALLEIARRLPLPGDNSYIGVEIVAFDLEEAGMLGGAEHARHYRDTGTALCGMASLEMIGYRDAAPKSQQLPRMLAGKYPTTGDFIAVIGNQNSSRLIERFRVAMRQVADLPVETLAVPDNGNWLQASRLSDHSPFWDLGYAALMITDTSFLRNPNYHRPSDTLETLDLDFLAQVTQGTLYAVHAIQQEGL